jgi:hypothetical protein
MTQANQPLQRRAGLNIGIEPNVGVHLQDAGAKERILNTQVGAETVILECPPKTARTPLVTNSFESAGIIVNNTANAYSYRVYFRDELGNDIPLSSAPPVTISNNDVGNFSYGDLLEETGFTLTPGQKIVIKTEAALPPPP